MQVPYNYAEFKARPRSVLMSRTVMGGSENAVMAADGTTIFSGAPPNDSTTEYALTWINAEARGRCDCLAWRAKARPES